ncbi:RNA helicase [Iamia sp. SCSIO 61187]|uniref:DEAD/DEAH box helicase n=1 Tax=Iamia sp. SCSIO 61187 TaxID=2722752 RepID=UPI001C62CA82|nr:DEAD/DEAH box helicase [Iamia sp. SCSIO 61187]
MTGPVFTLDRFQVEAAAAVDEGASVLVSAPTGSGKTVVADHAVDRALAQGLKAFYTTPIKALSNQKHADLRARLGADRVGLITGDTTINADAQVVVMTTEVLRNMLYARSPALEGLGVVVLDEVHYLQDRYRGPVWEEVIIHLPRGVQIVALSATVSNADELAGWIDAVRGRTVSIVETERPVELVSLYAAHDRATRQLVVVPVAVDGEPNPFGPRLDPEPADPRRDRRDRARKRYATPRRVEVVEHLADEELLPAIVFVFSRKGCDDAARTLLESGIVLTDPSERRRIRALAAAHTAGLSDADLDVLDHARWLAALEAGIAAHHAGMVPPFKEAVEACFVQGLVKVVFATETLALGINMPARSVVIEALSKFTGEQHEMLTPGEYTQLTGRAGRRGLDDEGRALVLWSPFTRFQEVADLVLSRRFELRSRFRPTYNMAANLVRRHDIEEARKLLDRSFAQYQSDHGVVRLRARREARAETLARLEGEARCERGDVEEYRRLRRADDEDRHQAVSRRDVLSSLARLRPGDVVWMGRNRVAVLSVGWRGPERGRLHVVDETGRARTVSSSDVDEVLHRVGEIELPVPYAPSNRAFQHDVGRSLAQVRGMRRRNRGGRTPAPSAPHHPVADCPDADRHLRSLAHAARVRSELADLDRRIASSKGSLTRELDRVVEVLEARGMVADWELTARGALLVRVFHECDLLIADCLAAGLLDGLGPAEVAAVASCFTYEHRSKVPPPAPWYPTRALRQRVEAVLDRAEELRSVELAAGLPGTRPPDPTFLPLAHAWASGRELDTVLDDEEMSGGDFVRNVRQLIDLLRQLGDAALDPATRSAARAASDALHRGVVAASTVTRAVGGSESPVAPAPPAR